MLYFGFAVLEYQVFLQLTFDTASFGISYFRIFSKASPLEQINVRIDDKLSRIKNQQEDEDEDVEKDMVGYLILKMVCKKLLKKEENTNV